MKAQSVKINQYSNWFTNLDNVEDMLNHNYYYFGVKNNDKYKMKDCHIKIVTFKAGGLKTTGEYGVGDLSINRNAIIPIKNENDIIKIICLIKYEAESGELLLFTMDMSKDNGTMIPKVGIQKLQKRNYQKSEIKKRRKEDILIKHMNTVVDNNLEKIDEDDEITENDKDILVPRTVRYGYPIDWFIKIIKDTKRIAISDEDINHPDSLSGEHYKYWLYFSLTILAGIVKDSNFEQEQETRFLFQNRYSDSYVRQNAIYALERMRISNIFKILGIDKEVKDNVNRRMELNLCGTFNSKLIPKIIVGDQCELDLNNLKELLKTSGLTETIILTRKGKQL